MARKVCIDCGLRPQVSGNIELCTGCDEYAGWENTHSDSGHYDIDTYSLENTTFSRQVEVDNYIADTKIEMESCPVCHPELDTRPTTKTTREGHHSPRRQQLNHRTQCTHPQTPAARRECRKAYWAAQAAK